MSETTPETSDLRDRLAEALCPPHHRAGWASMLTDAQGRTTTQSSPRVPCHLHRSHAQALLPVVAQEIAAAEQRGRAEVRARVEAELTHDSNCAFAQGYDTPCRCYLSDVLAALAEPTAEEHP